MDVSLVLLIITPLYMMFLTPCIPFNELTLDLCAAAGKFELIYHGHCVFVPSNQSRVVIFATLPLLVDLVNML